MVQLLGCHRGQRFLRSVHGLPRNSGANQKVGGKRHQAKSKKRSPNVEKISTDIKLNLKKGIKLNLKKGHKMLKKDQQTAS